MIGPAAPARTQKGPCTWECPRTGIQSSRENKRDRTETTKKREYNEEPKRWRQKRAKKRQAATLCLHPAGTESRISAREGVHAGDRQGGQVRRCDAGKTPRGRRVARGGSRWLVARNQERSRNQGTARLSNCGCCFRARNKLRESVLSGQYGTCRAHSVHPTRHPLQLCFSLVTRQRCLAAQNLLVCLALSQPTVAPVRCLFGALTQQETSERREGEE